MKSAESAGIRYWRCPYCGQTKPIGFSYRSHLKNDCSEYSGTPESGGVSALKAIKWCIIAAVPLSVAGRITDGLGPTVGGLFLAGLLVAGWLVYRRSEGGESGGHGP